MATTLAEIQAAHQDKLVQGFINEIITENYLLGAMTFDDCLTSTGTSNLVYAYNRVVTPATAHFRELNAEPTKSEVKVKKVTTKVSILSDAWNMDRVAKAAADDFYQLKVEESKNSIVRGFSKCVIQGDSAASNTDTETNGFDGLDKILKGTSTEMTSAVDLTSVDKEGALAWAEEMDTLLSALTTTPDVLLVSPAMKVKLNAICRVLGLATTTADSAGHQVSTWNGIHIQEMKDGALTTNDVYALCLGLEKFHGVTLSGGNAISVNLPDWSQPGAVKTGDAEFVCGIALKATKAAGVLRAHVEQTGA